MTNVDLAVQFFLQIAIILVVCRIVGLVAARFGQPQVVAEMIAGVVLGPSVFGTMAPEIQAWVFPWDASQKTRDTQSYLFPASQLGLALYMFIVGLEFRVDVIRRNLRCSIAVSLAGMVAPFLLGAGLAAFFFYNTSLFPTRTTLSEAMLFLGASMCITAFPMLARIIHYKGLAGTLMGTVAIGAGAIDDVTAWCLLALVLASFDGDPSRAGGAILGGAAFVLVAAVVLRPALARGQRWMLRHRGDREGAEAPATGGGHGIDTARSGDTVSVGGTTRVDGKSRRLELSDAGLAMGLACMALGAWFTDLIHLHAVFGAFVIGAMMPRGAVSDGLIARIQPLAVALLLPLFFTYSGLNTRIGLLNSWYLWGMSLLVLVAAILGKGVACYFAARATGLTHRDSLGIGTLMNARGLMELIIINIGLQRGIISEELFAALVIMAIITTLMASPLFDAAMRNGAESTNPNATPTAKPIHE
jgi:Kef-type K+ transport system membrane component KefB